MRRWISIVMLALAALALPAGAVFASEAFQEPGESDDLVIFGNSVVVRDGETVDGNVVVIGGALRLEDGGRIKGDVVAIGGSLELDGEIDGEVVSIGAALEADGDAQIDGETFAIGGDVDIDEDASFAGGFASIPGPDLTTIPVPTVSQLPSGPVNPLSPLSRGTAIPLSSMIKRLVGALNWALVVGILAVLVLLAWPVPLERVGQAVTRAPAAVGGVGCLSMFLFPVLGVGLAATLILIPLTLVLMIVFLAVLLFGWVAVGMLFGERLLEWFGTKEITSRNAGVAGTFGRTLLVGIVGALPGLGWLGLLSGLVLATVGVGAVVLTRFGWHTYGPARLAAGEGQNSALAAEAETGDN
jgi:hypothetical protein